jgi:hypothetical protein
MSFGDWPSGSPRVCCLALVALARRAGTPAGVSRRRGPGRGIVLLLTGRLKAGFHG